MEVRKTLRRVCPLVNVIHVQLVPAGSVSFHVC